MEWEKSRNTYYLRGPKALLIIWMNECVGLHSVHPFNMVSLRNNIFEINKYIHSSHKHNSRMVVAFENFG